VQHDEKLDRTEIIMIRWDVGFVVYFSTKILSPNSEHREIKQLEPFCIMIEKHRVG